MKRSSYQPPAVAMRKAPIALWSARCALLASIALTNPAMGASGILITGFGAESAGMAGVDVAMARDTAALINNPAGLAQLSTAAADLYLEPFYALGNNHRDRRNPTRNVNNRSGLILGGGYAQPLLDGRLVAGVGVFAQGGFGDVYKNLETAFGTRDEISALFGVTKLIPALAWKISPELRIGAGLGINYATTRQRFFPQTSSFDPERPEDAFFGTALDDAASWSINGEFGLQYAISPRLTVAAAYSSKTPIKLEDGTLTVNYEAIGLERVTYREVTVRGLALPEKLGIGARYRLTPRWLLAAEATWLNNQDALKAIAISASAPDNGQAESSIVNRQVINARDQYAFSVAVEHQLNASTVLRAGYHHATEMIPPRNLSPVLALIAEDLIAVGFATDINDNWRFSSAIEWQLPTAVSYANPDLPFGNAARAQNSAVLLTLMLSWRR